MIKKSRLFLYGFLLLAIVLVLLFTTKFSFLKSLNSTGKATVEGINLDSKISLYDVDIKNNSVTIKMKENNESNYDEVRFIFSNGTKNEEIDSDVSPENVKENVFNFTLKDIKVDTINSVSVIFDLKENHNGKSNNQTENNSTNITNSTQNSTVKKYYGGGGGGGGGGGSSSSSSVCNPDCQGRVCGVDPVCGTLDCGSCSSSQTCNAGVCVTTNQTDTISPVITNVASSGIISNSATITWTTNEPADGKIQYGLTINYGTNTTLNPSLVTSHSQIISGLSSNKLYHFRVWSKDSAGNVNISTDFNFTTTSTGAAICEATGTGKCYYVSIAGNDNNNGSFASPFKTVHKGVQQVSAGDILYIRSGTYSEIDGNGCFAGNDCGTLHLTKSGTQGNPIIIKGYPGDTKPIIQGAPGRYVAFLENANYVVLDSLEITGGYRGLMLVTSNYVTIKNCLIHHNDQDTGGNNQAGILILFNGANTVTNILIENNTIHDNWFVDGDNNNGIHIYSGTNVSIVNNNIYNQFEGVYIKGEVVDQNGLDDNISIHGNLIHDVDGGIAVHGQGTERNIQVYQNTIYSFSWFGLKISGTDGEQGANNIGYGKNLQFYNNIIDCSVGNKIGFSSRLADPYDSTVMNKDIYVKNNIFYKCGNDADSYAEAISQIVQNYVENYNLIYSPGVNSLFKWGLTNTYNLSQWQSTYGNGLNDKTSNPLFVNINSHNYDLQSSSPAINNGTYISGFHCSLADDNGGAGLTNCVHWCGSAPDIGAVEYC